MTERPPAASSLLLRPVRDVLRRSVVTCPPSVTAVEVARRLSSEGVGSLVVVGEDGAPVGIVTDRDLRRKVLAAGRDPVTTPAAAIMSAPLVTLPPEAFGSEAVLEMTRRRITHVVVVDEGRAIGVVSARDFLALEAAHPITLAREIVRASSLDVLEGLATRVTGVARRLLDEGGRAYGIGRIVAELNDRIVRRVVELTEDELRASGAGGPPVPYCFLVFGSEARREQTLRTDQDNGLVWEDPPVEAAPAAEAWFRRLGEATIAGLVRVGFPPCPASHMASNPAWRQPVSAWTACFRWWMHEAGPEQVLAACIHFDLRAAAGAEALAERLAGLVRAEAPEQRKFLTLLARDLVGRRPPLTLFGNIGVRRSGPMRGTVDVKGAGSLQLVSAGRLHALELGLPETSTVDRFRAAAGRGLYTPEEAREVEDAFQHLTRLRLGHQLARIEAGLPPDNDINPARLPHADVLLFRDALRTVTWVQGRIRERYATDFAPGG